MTMQHPAANIQKQPPPWSPVTPQTTKKRGAAILRTCWALVSSVVPSRTAVHWTVGFTEYAQPYRYFIIFPGARSKQRLTEIAERGGRWIMSPHEVYGILMGNLRSNKCDIFEIWDGLKIENPKILCVQMKRNNRIDVLYCASHRLGFLWLILTFTAPSFFVSTCLP